MLILTKVMGFLMSCWAILLLKYIATGLLHGRIEFTTKGSKHEVWYSQMESPIAFWIVILFYSLSSVVLIGLAYELLKKNPPSAR